MSENKNEIVISAGAALGNQLVPELFKDIDFNGLNNAIESMAQASGELTAEDKELARGIIGEWEQSVIQRLYTKQGEMQSFIGFFNASLNDLHLGHLAFEEFSDELAAKTSTEDLLKKVIITKDAVDKHIGEQPERPIKSEITSFEEDVKAQKEYEAKAAIHEMKSKRLYKEHAVAVGDWKRAMNDTQIVKDLLTQARKFTRGADKMRQTATDKSQLAKLNISIASKTARDSLKELLKFTTNI